MTDGVELRLTGSADDLRTELAQADLIYTRSPGYDGTDAIQVLVYTLAWLFFGLSGLLVLPPASAVLYRRRCSFHLVQTAVVANAPEI